MSSAVAGNNRPWDPDCWVAQDDCVRGGASRSHLRRADDGRVGLFCGHLDISALGGAGFASQRSRDLLDLDLSGYQGLDMSVARADGMRYTLVLKDEVPEARRDDGREQSSLSWEFDFLGVESGGEGEGEGEGGKVRVDWAQFKPTYRGRPKPDSRPLDLKSIKRIAIMARSFFGDQEGDFELGLRHIAAVPYSNHNHAYDHSSSGSDSESLPDKTKKADASAPEKAPSTWFRWFSCGR